MFNNLKLIHFYRSISTLNNSYNTVGSVLSTWKRRFEENNVLEPESSIKIIISHAIKTKKFTDLFRNKHKTLNVHEMQNITKMCFQRLQKVPLQYIIGEWEFKGLTLKMRSPVFIPRPETEQLVDLVLEEINYDEAEVLELCCGSGAISIALLKSNNKLKITAIDKSEDACKLTVENARLHNVQDRIIVFNKKITAKDDLDFLGKRFKVIVSNPPYIPSKDIEILQEEIKWYEDRDALDGGPDGLDLIKTVLAISSRNALTDNGAIFLEVDPQQPELLGAYLCGNPALRLAITDVRKDLFNVDRFVTIRRKEKPKG